MENLFKVYDEKFKYFGDLLHDEVLPRELRLFNIRFRIALDINVNFLGKYSFTKTKNVKDTYIIIIKLMELWNSYEALLNYIKQLNKYSLSKTTKSRVLSQTFLREIGVLEKLKDSLKELKEKYCKNTTFKKDFKQYIKRIIDDENIKQTLTNDSKIVLDYFENKKDISGIEILSLIYAERNMYYHNGESARMGMNYENRQFLINNYITCLKTHILIIINYILDKEIESLLGKMKTDY